MRISVAPHPSARRSENFGNSGARVQLVITGARAFRCSKSSGRLLYRVVFQKAAQSGLASYLCREGRLGRVIEVQWDNIADSLMRALGVVMALDRGQCSPQVRFAQQNQIIERFADFSDMALGVRTAKRGMRGRFEDAQVSAFQYPIQGQKSGVTVMVEAKAGQRCRHKAKEIKSIVQRLRQVPDYRTRIGTYPLWSLLAI